MPAYLDQECLSEFENRLSLARFMVSKDQMATLSKQEVLFGFTKMSRYWHAGVL